MLFFEEACNVVSFSLNGWNLIFATIMQSQKRIERLFETTFFCLLRLYLIMGCCMKMKSFWILRSMSPIFLIKKLNF